MIELSRVKRIHFVGIGGSGMSGIAEVLHNIGFTVSGSDIAESDTVRRLKSKGIIVFIGHKKENILGVETLVYSSAVDQENPEVAEALNMRIPVIPRAEMLAELMRVKFAITVAGTHGKTTTTSMIAAILTVAGKDPTFVVGGRLRMEDSGARLGQSVYLVAEADESDGSFLKLFPTLAVITNIEDDHLDFYRNIDNLRTAFVDFANKVPFYGAIIANLDCPETLGILPRMNKRIITFSCHQDAHIKAQNIRESVFSLSFDLIVKDQNQGPVELNIGGKHNVSNALAAIAAAIETGIDIPTIKKGLAQFYLPDRRFQILYRDSNYLVIDDYAHHPTEIQATIDTLKSGSYKRITAIFQPHRYTRLEILMDRFASCFQGVDRLIIAPIYSANQQKIPNIDSEALLKKIKASGFQSVEYIDSFEEIIDNLQSQTRAGDAVLFLSAGNLTRAAHDFAARISKSIQGK